jgi:phosphoesterase RecJ-like protein
MFEQVLTEIKNYKTIIIHRHSSPDGDALGSQIGLKHIIQDNFPEKTVYVVGDGAKRYSFMDGSTMDEIDDSEYEGALAFILDCGASSLVSDDRYKKAAKVIRIDHHIYCENFADIEIVDTSYESCCGLITELALECGFSDSNYFSRAFKAYRGKTPREYRKASKI